MSKEVVLVTGGTGLVGKAIEAIVKAECPQLSFVFLSTKDGDLRDFTATKRIFEQYRPSMVIHCAAMVGGIFRNIDNHLNFFRTNMQINDNLHLGQPHESTFGYSYAKRMIDVWNQAYSRQQTATNTKTIFTSVVPTNVYGPFDNFNIHDSHVIPGLINKAYLAVKEAKEKEVAKLIVFGSGEPQRQFIYSFDLARLIVWVLLNYNEVDPIILSVDEEDEISIEKAATLVADAFSRRYNVQFEIVKDTSMAEGQFKKTA
ncbi:hypothetical protein B4U80_05460, partial [Leptotrombidium deliense]